MSGDLGLCLVWEAEMRERGLWREVERAKRILALQPKGGGGKQRWKFPISDAKTSDIGNLAFLACI